MISDCIDRMSRAACHYTAALLLSLSLLTGCNEANNKPVARSPPSVGVSAPVQKAITPYLELTGSITAVATVNLVARVNGYLKSINYVDGATVKLGDLLFEIERAPYEAKVKQAEADLAATRAVAVQTEAEFQRQNTLAQEGVNTPAQLDLARKNRDSAKANTLANEANLQEAQIDLSYTRVEAPFDGVVTRHLASLGELVGTAGHTDLASIVQLHPIYVTFNMSDHDLEKFRADDGIRRLTLAELLNIPVEVGLNDEEGFPHKGKLDYVSPSIDPQTATVLARAIFENRSQLFVPGMFARIRLPVGPPVSGALVPDRIVQQNQQGSYLLVVGADDEVEQRPVKLGQLDGSLRVITSGLKPDDRVVVTALDRAIPGRKVTTRPFSLASATDGELVK